MTASFRRRSFLPMFASAFLLQTPHLAHAQAPTYAKIDNAGYRWFRGNTHVHAFKTPAAYPPERAAEWYASHGFDFIVQTEHEFVVDPAQIKVQRGFLLIPGQEITQAVVDSGFALGVRHAHVNALGSRKVIEPIEKKVDGNGLSLTEQWIARAAAGSVRESLSRNIRLVREQMAVPQVNHPAGGPLFAADLEGIPGPYLLEIWNAYPFGNNNLGGIDDQGRTIPSTEQLWDHLLSSGVVVWGTASDDVHDYENFDKFGAPVPGKAWIMVRSRALTESEILSALRQGQFYASNGVYLGTITATDVSLALKIEFPPEDQGYGSQSAMFRTRFIGPHGKLLAVENGRAPFYRFTGNESYVRAVVTDSDGRKAWTQPVFVRNAK